MGLKVNVGEMISALRGTREGLGALADGVAETEIAEAMRAEGERLLLEGFAAQTAPDGSAWATARRDYGHPLLRASGDMLSSARCEVVTADGTRIALLFTVADEKAAWHQFGTARGGPTTSALRAQHRKSFRAGESERMHIPARKMIFDDGEQPAPWMASLEAVGQSALDRFLTARITL